MFPDQTPTPTRFLKNCEEVGLFSELDCSIEQEFCKAQEEEDSKQVRLWCGSRSCDPQN